MQEATLGKVPCDAGSDFYVHVKAHVIGSVGQPAVHAKGTGIRDSALKCSCGAMDIGT